MSDKPYRHCDVTTGLLPSNIFFTAADFYNLSANFTMKLIPIQFIVGFPSIAFHVAQLDLN